ncbi:death domain-containing protein 1 [Osmerus eperlanus]|uniref:death domain-containing protein 1 n=1 Tax=Osmerus eperlanus TaxID=29151 RepID=UPI002E155343
MAEAKTAFQTNPLTRVTSQSQPCPLDSGCHENTHSASESHDAPGFESAQPRLGAILPEDGAEDASCSQGSDGRGVSDLNYSRPQAGLGGEGESEPREREEQTSTGAEGKGKIEGDVVRTVEPETDIHKDNPLKADEHREREAEREKEMHREGKRARGGESQLVTSGLTGRSTNGQADVPDACYVTAPEGVAQVLTCEVVETLSSLMVIGSEELVSSVMRVKVQDGSQCQFPITVAVPFRARYRGNYRDVVVKVIDGDGRVSSISPVSTEGTFGGQKGSFAQVRVYALGLFAVLSCLKRESYTVHGRGLSIKLSMDPRVCLDYLPGSFTAPVVVQSMVQPVDTPLLSSLKSSSEVYHSLVSTTPLLHLAHPTSQPLRRPLSLTLPCPPGADKRRAAGWGEEPERPISVAPPRDTPGLRRARALSASAQCSRESSNELLVLLGWREEQWNVLEKTTVRNLQNGLVSFELTENYERLMVMRLFSSMRSSHLVSLVEEVEACVQRTMVTIVLQRRRDDPQAAVVAVFPSRDLGWELSKLRAQAYCGPPEPSQETPMCEGEQLLLSFTGNVTCAEHLNNQTGSACVPITFHSQRKNRLFLRLTEVDPFGNYSSPHYKGTAVFHKVARGQLERRGDEALPSSSRPLDEPVCKLSLTLPKKVRSICRPVSAKVKLCDETEALSDALLCWLSRELSEEDLTPLVLSLRLRRSSIQMVRLQAPDSLPAQALHILGLWRRSLPAAPQPSKSSQLAHCLAKSGRPDLAKELLLRQDATRGGSSRALGEAM